MLFSVATASGLSDRFAAVSNVISQAVLASTAEGPAGDLFDITTTTDVYAIERDFITPTYTFETNLSGVQILGNAINFKNFLGAFDTHTQAEAQVTYNTFLTNSGLQVSEYFAQVWNVARGSNLSAHNVFSQSDVVLCTLNYAGPSSFTFANGTPLGSGGTSTYSSGNTGEQRLQINLQSGVTTTTSLNISVSGLDDAGHSLTATATIPANLTNAHAAFTPSVKMRTVSNAQVVGVGSGLTAGNILEIKNVRERIIQL